MDKMFKPMLIGKVKEDITFQGIGGKEIIIEREVNMDTTPLTTAVHQFLERRIASGKVLPDVAYYGHINGLGYFVSKMEVEDVREATDEDIRRVW